MKRGRSVLLVTVTAYVVMLVWSALVLPERLPSHFDGSGRVDATSSRASFLVMWSTVGLVVLVGIPLIGRWAASGDGTWVNMPQHYKDHWFAPDRRAEFRGRFQDDLELFAAITGAMLIACLVVITWVGATGRDAAPWWSFAALVGGYLVATAVWTVALLRAYRPPSPEA